MTVTRVLAAIPAALVAVVVAVVGVALLAAVCVPLVLLRAVAWVVRRLAGRRTTPPPAPPAAGLAGLLAAHPELADVADAGRRLIAADPYLIPDHPEEDR